MSITTPDDRISTYNPVVATTTFAALFPVFDNSDLSVFVDGVERNDFTVSATYINSISDDAAVVFSPGIVGEVQVIGTRDPRRISRFLDGAPLPTRDQNTALDVVMASLQELARDVRRAVKVGFGAIGFNVDTTGIADNSVLMYRDDKIVIGPTAGDVANAQTNAASAADSAIKAQKWADNPLNQEVIAGRFSAMHWALKALEWAGAGVAGVSSFNGRTGAVSPQAADYPSKQDATHAAPSKSAVADADEFNVADSDDSFKAKRSTLTELISSIFKTGRAIANAQFVAATFKLLNGSGKAMLFDTSALSADRTITLPDENIDLANVGVGAKQTWQTPSRSIGSVYQNTTGRTIQLHISCRQVPTNALLQVSVDNVSWVTLAAAVTSSSDGQGAVLQASPDIPAGHYYRVTGTSITGLVWAELRT
jgi:hypothetical protein